MSSLEGHVQPNYPECLMWKVKSYVPDIVLELQKLHYLTPLRYITCRSFNTKYVETLYLVASLYHKIFYNGSIKGTLIL